MNVVDRTLYGIQERRERLLRGGINSIPSKFTRFMSEFIGIEQKKYYIVTGATKSGKTQFASFTFLYTPLLYAYANPDKIRIKIFYYSLEETPEDVTRRFMSYLLYEMRGIRISPTDLESSANNPVDQKILDYFQEEDIKPILEFYEQHVEFSPSRNPTGVNKEVEDYMRSNGTVHWKKVPIRDDISGELKEVRAFDYYEPNDPDEYVIVIFDHLSLIQQERGMTLKQTADKLSEYFVILRNRYGVTPVLIQQQSFEMESLDAFKERKLRPTAQGLADTKYTARDCNVLLGIFNPFKHDLPDYKRYNITLLRDNCRFLEVILNRGGSSGGLVALFFDGAICNWCELPRADETEELNKVYQYIKTLGQTASAAWLFLFKAIMKRNFLINK